ncbi:MAG: type II secretion system protein N [Brevundimonas sp.]
MDMFAASLFRRPASRAQAMTEVVLAALLALQPGLWIWTLGEAERGQEEPAALRIGLNQELSAPPGGDPFFGNAVSASPLAPHTLYAVRAGARAGAIVAGPDGVQKAVGVGETVSEGVVLAAVAADHVVLAHGRSQTRLGFPASPPRTDAGPPQSALGPMGRAGVGSAAAETVTYATALRPVSVDGSDGYVWRPGTDGGVLAAAGLRPGDVILRINGTPFDRSERLEELAADIAEGHPVVLDYRRNGVVLTGRFDPE